MKTRDLEKQMKELNPDAHCTYYPMEQEFLVFVGNQQLTGKMHPWKTSALNEAIEVLKKRKQ